jgi:hypothetical protein
VARPFLYPGVSVAGAPIQSQPMSRDERIRLLAAVVAAALAAALLGACGDSGSGGGSDQFRAQAKSPLLDFGEEGSEAELEQAEAAVSDFLAVHSREDWEATCDLLSNPMKDKLERLATNSTGLEDTSCAAFLDAFAVLSAQEKRDGAEIEGGSLRRQGAKGYLIYSGSEEVVYAMPLDQQDGEWRVAAISAQRLG